MQKLITGLILATSLLAVPAFADFEGTLEMKMSGGSPDGQHQASGTTLIYVSKAGVRSEVKMSMGGGGGMTMATLMKFKEPKIVYQLNDAAKTYAVMDTAKLKGKQQGPPERYTVKKLGVETVAGYKAQHVSVSDSKSNEFEMWTTKDIVNFERMERLMGGQGMDQEGMMAALKKEGAEGFVVKLQSKGSRDNFTMELVRVEKKALPASLFEIPAGYEKQEGMAAQIDLPPEAKAKMKEAMEKMTPEQREMVKKMMEGKGAGKPE